MKYLSRFAAGCVALLAVALIASGSVVVQDPTTGRIYCRSRRFLVPYQAADSGPSGIRDVRLYYTVDSGNKWVLYGEKPEAEGAFEFVAPGDGVYGFTVEAIDKAGNKERKGGPMSGSAAEITVVVDTKPPQIEPIFPRQDLELAPGAHIRVRFGAHDPNIFPSSARVSIRKDDEPDWTPLPSATVANGEFFGEGDVLYPGTYTVKIEISDRAGNAAVKSFTFTCTKQPKSISRAPGPIGRNWIVPITAPPRAKSLVFDIDYKVEDIGGQAPAAVGLWYTTDSGATWQFYGLDPDVTPPFRFQAPKEGVYGFKLTATTRSGVSEPPPGPGTKPDIVTLVDITYPSLMLEDPRGDESYAGGRVHFIRWTARDEHFGSLPISIYLSRDGGSWELLAADLPNTGTYGWNVPLIDYATYRLKAEARDAVGNQTSVISDTFYVVSAPPETRIKGVFPAAEAVGIKELAAAKQPAQPAKPEAETTEPVEPTPPPTGKSDAKVKDLVDRATALRLSGDWEAAEKALREAAERDAYNVEVKNELGALLIQEGRQAAAVEILKDARTLAPKDRDVLYNLAVAYYALGRYVDSVAAFETLVQLDPSNEPALWDLARAQYAAKDTARARATWMRLAALDVPGSPYAKRARLALSSVQSQAQ